MIDSPAYGPSTTRGLPYLLLALFSGLRDVVGLRESPLPSSVWDPVLVPADI